MGDNLLWVALLGGEIFAVLFILLFISWLLAMRQKRRDRKAIKDLVSRVADNRAQRLEGWRGILARNYGLSGADRERAAVSLLNAELRMINAFCEIYLQRKDQAAALFDKSLYTNLEAIQSLEVSARAMDEEPQAEPEPIEAPVEDGAQPTNEGLDDMAFLRAENKRLTEELRVTMETMSRMLNEYSTMFGSDGTKNINEVMEVVDLDDDAAPGVEAESAGDMPAEDLEAQQEEDFDLSVLEESDDAVAVKAEDELVAEALASATEETMAETVAEETIAGESEGEGADLSGEDLLEPEPEAEIDLTPETEAVAHGDAEAEAGSDEGSLEPGGEAEVLEPDDELVLDDAAVDLNDEIDSLFDEGDEVVTELDEDLFDLQTEEEDERDKK